MEVHFKIIGILLMALSVVHIVFPKYFNWKRDLGSLSQINREMMYVHMFFIAVGIFLMGLLCLGSSKELVSTGLGKKITLGMGMFWTLRLLVQFFGYSSVLWRGKRLETAIHILFSGLWIYLSSVFLSNYWI
jgi:hypothetical protein